MHVLKIRDKDGKLVPIPAIRGERGKSAYEQAKEGGYQGTEEEFIAILNGLINPVSPADVDPSHIDDRNNPHNVTAEQAGALPKTGGEMEGAIKWNDGRTHIIGQSDGNFIIQNYKASEEGHDDFISFHNTLDLAGALTFHRDGKSYTIYGMHNKPSASDVGAVSKKGDTLTGALNFNNTGDYFALTKTRTVGETDHKLTLGVAASGGATLEHYAGDALDSRLELDANGLVLKKSTGDTGKKFFGEHNKPIVTYTGNSDSQTIQVGGIGTVAWLVTSNGVQGLVSKHGLLGVTASGQISNQDSSHISFENGVLTLKNGGFCNTAGHTYTIQVL